MEEKTGITFHEAQVALARKWIGKIGEDWKEKKDLGKFYQIKLHPIVN